MPLWQLRGCVRVLRKDPTTQVAEYINGHGLSTGQLWYQVVDLLRAANWQRTGKKSGRPRPLDQLLKEAAEKAEQERRAADAADDADNIVAFLSQFDPANQPADGPEEVTS